MTQRQLRARDVDRDAAIDIVEAAWADGQLTREEYDRRTDWLLRAPTLGDLEKQILDLQPEGVTWQPRVAEFARVTAAPPAVIEQKRTSRPVAVGLALVFAVVVVLAMVSAFDGDDPTQPVVTPQEPAKKSLTAAGFVAARDALEDHAGSDTVYSAELTSGRFTVVRPTSGASTDAVATSFDGTQWSPDTPAESGDERLSLGLVNADAVSSILATARQQLDGEAEPKLVFEIARQGGQRICITATADGDSKWRATYDCRGQEVEQ